MNFHKKVLYNTIKEEYGKRFENFKDEIMFPLIKEFPMLLFWYWLPVDVAVQSNDWFGHSLFALTKIEDPFLVIHR